MAVPAATSLRWPRVRAPARARVAAALGLGAIVAVSVLVRTANLGVGYWVDEGLSVGIADRPVTDIPGILRQDGSPPLYYALLHVWIRLLGDTGERATHALSLLVATVSIPVAWGLARSLFGARAGWIAAVLVALNPFLNVYAQETRMYALVVALALISVACFTAAFALARPRRWTVAFALAHAALLWTHNWGLFLGAGLAAGWAVLVAAAPDPERRRLVREGLLAAGLIALLYAPWIPTLLFQVAHTGAPWANAPQLEQLGEAPRRLLGLTGQWLLLIGAGAGLAPLLRDRPRAWSAPARAVVVLAVAAVGTLTVPWLLSQASPAWATRYTAVAVAPLVLGAALGLSRAGGLGIAVCAACALLWLNHDGPREKSNVRAVAREVAPSLRPGDLVVVTQPEQAPVAHHYLEADGATGLRWATLWGPLPDLGVTDWRDGVERIEATSPQRDLAPLLDRVRPGARVMLLMPDLSHLARWRAPWSALVRRRTVAWEQWMRNDARFRVVSLEPTSAFPSHPNPVRALIAAREPVG